MADFNVIEILGTVNSPASYQQDGTAVFNLLYRGGVKPMNYIIATNLRYLIEKTIQPYIMLVEQLKTKDITRSRIARALLHLLLGYTESDRQKFIGSDYACYANILALKKESSSLIRQLHESSMIPVITKKADFDTILSAYPAIDTELARTMWQYDLRATELYNCIYYNHYGITLPNDYTRKLPVL